MLLVPSLAHDVADGAVVDHHNAREVGVIRRPPTLR